MDPPLLEGAFFIARLLPGLYLDTKKVDSNKTGYSLPGISQRIFLMTRGRIKNWTLNKLYKTGVDLIKSSIYRNLNPHHRVLEGP